VRCKCLLKEGCANVLLCLPAGLSLQVEGAAEPYTVATVAGVLLELEVGEPGGQSYTVLCDVEKHDLQALATVDVGRCCRSQRGCEGSLVARHGTPSCNDTDD